MLIPLNLLQQFKEFIQAQGRRGRALGSGFGLPRPGPLPRLWPRSRTGQPLAVPRTRPWSEWGVSWPGDRFHRVARTNEPEGPDQPALIAGIQAALRPVVPGARFHAELHDSLMRAAAATGWAQSVPGQWSPYSDGLPGPTARGGDRRDVSMPSWRALRQGSTARLAELRKALPDLPSRATLAELAALRPNLTRHEAWTMLRRGAVMAMVSLVTLWWMERTGRPPMG